MQELKDLTGTVRCFVEFILPLGQGSSKIVEVENDDFSKLTIPENTRAFVFFKTAEATGMANGNTVTLRNERFDIQHCQLIQKDHPVYNANWEFLPGPPNYAGKIMVLDRH